MAEALRHLLPKLLGRISHAVYQHRSKDDLLKRLPDRLRGYGGLGSIDFEALARFFAKSKHKASTADAATAAVKRKVDSLVRMNPTREGLREQLERLIADYNEGAHSTKQFFDELLAFMKKVEGEEDRASVEDLDQERLALYDLVLVPGSKLSKNDREATKKIARELPKLLETKLVIDWRKSQRARAAVKATIKDALDVLPEAYTPAQYEQAVEAVYEHVFESYWGEGKSKYAGPSVRESHATVAGVGRPAEMTRQELLRVLVLSGWLSIEPKEKAASRALGVRLPRPVGMVLGFGRRYVVPKAVDICGGLKPWDVPAYTLPTAAWHVRIPAATLRSWVCGRSYPVGAETRRSLPLIKVANRRPRFLSFTNLVEAHVLSSMRRKHELPMGTVRKAIKYVEDELGVAHPLATEAFKTNGVDLFVERLGHRHEGPRHEAHPARDPSAALRRNSRRRSRSRPSRYADSDATIQVAHAGSRERCGRARDSLRRRREAEAAKTGQGATDWQEALSGSA
jgi:hypothetical protein